MDCKPNISLLLGTIPPSQNVSGTSSLSILFLRFTLHVEDQLWYNADGGPSVLYHKICPLSSWRTSCDIILPPWLSWQGERQRGFHSSNSPYALYLLCWSFNKREWWYYTEGGPFCSTKYMHSHVGVTWFQLFPTLFYRGKQLWQSEKCQSAARFKYFFCTQP